MIWKLRYWRASAIGSVKRFLRQMPPGFRTIDECIAELETNEEWRKAFAEARIEVRRLSPQPGASHEQR